MKKLFLDTEFTDLVPDNKLISIALVSEDGRYFYAELTDTYELGDCSEFVKANVLPILKGGPKMSEYECALKISQWIEDLGDKHILALDNISWDYPHLKKLIEMTSLWPANLERVDYFKFVVMDDDAQAIVYDNKFDIHNALDDAQAMRIAYQKGVMWAI